jgi:hypothetical protein
MSPMFAPLTFAGKHRSSRPRRLGPNRYHRQRLPMVYFESSAFVKLLAEEAGNELAAGIFSRCRRCLPGDLPVPNRTRGSPRERSLTLRLVAAPALPSRS